MCRETLITRRIVFGLLIVNVAIHFNDKTCGVAVKVGNEAVYDLLAAEVQAAQTISP